jgi:hypothetical protein
MLLCERLKRRKGIWIWMGRWKGFRGGRRSSHLLGLLAIRGGGDGCGKVGGVWVLGACVLGSGRGIVFP